SLSGPAVMIAWFGLPEAGSIAFTRTPAAGVHPPQWRSPCRHVNARSRDDPLVIDLHTHILPGLDDGARTLEESVAMARSAVAEGIRVMAATPHVSEDYPTRAAEMEQGLAQVREALALEGVALEVLPGGEIALDRLAVLEADE